MRLRQQKLLLQRNGMQPFQHMDWYCDAKDKDDENINNNENPIILKGVADQAWVGSSV